MAMTELGQQGQEPERATTLTLVEDTRPSRVTYADVVANQMRIPRGQAS